MSSRAAFLAGLGSGGLITASAGTGIAFPNIIVPGRGGTAYRNNIPLWTPKDALEHPLTVELNQVFRFTPEARRIIPNIDRVMLSKFRPTFVGPKSRPCTTCGGGGGKRKVTSARAVVPSSTFVGRALGANTAIPSIDQYGSQVNGYGLSGAQARVNGYGQSGVTVNKATVNSYGTGKYQIGTTTITAHPTLPMIRYTDPLFGSGVAYWEQSTRQIVATTTNFPLNTYYGSASVYYPSPNITPDVWVGLGLGVLGLVLTAAGVAVSLAAVTITTIALGFALTVLGVAAGIFAIIETLMNLPMAQPDPFTLQNGGVEQVPYAPPDDGGTDGNGDGGGGDGSDQYQVA